MTARPFVVACLLAVSASTLVGRPQTRDAGVRQAGTAVIAGVVVSDDPQPRPLRRSSVVLTGTGIPTAVETATDDSGRFAFPDLAAGRYTLTATKPSFLKTFYGSKAIGRGPATPILLADGQRIGDLKVMLVRGAVIAGTVLDQNGMPLASIGVSVDQWQNVGGERKLIAVPGFNQFAVSDDIGRYRIFGLPPGEYAVRAGGSSGMLGEIRESSPAEIAAAERELQGLPAASATGGRPATMAPPAQVALVGTYYPGVDAVSSAQFITVASGEERLGINIRKVLAAVVRVRVDGIAVGPSGQPVSNIMVGIANASAGSMWGSPGLIRSGVDGRFSIANLPAGRWLLFGRGMVGEGPTSAMPLSTETEFEVVDCDVSGVVMSFSAGSTVSGRVMFDGALAPPNVSAMRVALLGVPKIAGAFLNIPTLTPRDDGTFSFAGVAPGRYRVTVTGAGGWSLRSMLAGDRDALDAPLEVTNGRDVGDLVVRFTDRPTQVTGTLVDALGRPTPEFSVLMFSTDRAHWANAPRRMTGLVKLGADGRFAITNLPPGEYYISAVTDLEPGQLTDPAVLEQLAAGAGKIALTEGQHVTQNLRVGG